ncbi:MAG: hypothetical protein IJY84_01055 [Clostridia bacterium]|nr:hypothetical protein [Clostridia bacterium]
MFYYNKSVKTPLRQYKGQFVYNISTANDGISMLAFGKKKGEAETIEDLIAVLQTEQVVDLSFIKIEEDDLKKIALGVKEKLIGIESFSATGDLTFLENFPNLLEVSLHHSEKTEKIWDVSKNPLLKEITLYYAKSLKNIDGLFGSDIQKLIISGEHLAYEDKTDAPIIDDISALESLVNLTHLEFFTAYNGAKTTDLQVFASLVNLKFLRLARNYFSFKQIAWLKSRLPVVENLNADFYFLHQRWDDTFWYAIYGYDKPDWIQEKPENDIDKYFDEFKSLVEFYEQNPTPPNT